MHTQCLLPWIQHIYFGRAYKIASLNLGPQKLHLLFKENGPLPLRLVSMVTKLSASGPNPMRVLRSPGGGVAPDMPNRERPLRSLSLHHYDFIKLPLKASQLCLPLISLQKSCSRTKFSDSQPQCIHIQINIHMFLCTHCPLIALLAPWWLPPDKNRLQTKVIPSQL